MQWVNNTKVTDGPLEENLEGFCISLLKEMAKILKFKINITLVPDNKYGSWKGKVRGWTGMVRVLVENVSKRVNH